MIHEIALFMDPEAYPPNPGHRGSDKKDSNLSPRFEDHNVIPCQKSVGWQETRNGKTVYPH